MIDYIPLKLFGFLITGVPFYVLLIDFLVIWIALKWFPNKVNLKFIMFNFMVTCIVMLIIMFQFNQVAVPLEWIVG